MKKNVTHLIAGLGKGGAETTLYQLLLHRKNDNVKHRVISLGGSHFYEKLITELGIEVLELPFKKHPIVSFFKARNFLKQTKTDTLCCWMYHANLLGLFLNKFTARKLIWNVRHSDLSRELNSRKTLFINKLCAKISHKAKTIAYNGEKARQVHESVGYCRENGIVVDNGVDILEYVRDESARNSIINEIGAPKNSKVLLSVARNHPIKDIPGFIEAVSIVRTEIPAAVAVICGSGVEAGDEELTKICNRFNLEMNKNVFLLGLRHDVPKLMSAADVFVLHSKSEAFPNVLTQAMACECQCITTDVGDAAKILSNPTRTVPSSDSSALARAIILALKEDGEVKIKEGIRNREIICSFYSIDSVVKKYEDIICKPEDGLDE